MEEKNNRLHPTDSDKMHFYIIYVTLAYFVPYTSRVKSTPATINLCVFTVNGFVLFICIFFPLVLSTDQVRGFVMEMIHSLFGAGAKRTPYSPLM